MNKYTRFNGRIIQNFDWVGAQKAHGGPIWGIMGPANAALTDVIDAGIAKADELKRDPAFTAIGRKQQLTSWFQATALPKLKAVRSALAAAEAEVETTRAKMTVAQIDKSDVAGALLRGEIRTWLRGMDPAKRSTMLVMGSLPQATSLAILEAPAELSGVSAKEHARLQATVLESAHPAETAKIRAIEEGAQALASVERAALMALTEATGVGRGEVDEMLGAQPLSARIREMLGVEEPEPETEAA
jgi:hypothetical protein